MARVVYISYTGIAEPLGESQVLQYLLALAKDHTIALITFERPAALKNTARMAELRAVCEDAGITWRALTYHNKPSVPATVWDILVGTRVGIVLARRTGADLIHARSYLPGIMAMRIARAIGARFLFDIRGFWPEERLESGLWKAHEMRYRLMKRLEKALYRNADHVVTLTRAGARQIERFDFLDSVPPIDVIPTCTNLEVFARQAVEKADEFTLCYVGSIRGRYLFHHVASVVATLFSSDPDAKFLVLNQGSHDEIARRLTNAGVDMARVTLTEAPYHEVARRIAMAHAGIWFLQTGYSLQASCPTKMGEFLACGVPLLANAGVGDVAEDLEETGTGVAVRDFKPDTLRAALEAVMALSRAPDIAARCRAAAEARFSLANGVAKYDQIWRSLEHQAGRSD